MEKNSKYFKTSARSVKGSQKRTAIVQFGGLSSYVPVKDSEKEATSFDIPLRMQSPWRAFHYLGPEYSFHDLISYLNFMFPEDEEEWFRQMKIISDLKTTYNEFKSDEHKKMFPDKGGHKR